jgi:HEAT repeat protein
MVMSILIFWVRMTQTLREQRERRFQEFWRPVMVQCLEGIPVNHPMVDRSEWCSFLSLWNYFQESLLGGSRRHLNELARRCDMHVAARRLVEIGVIRERLLGILTLGHLSDESSWGILRRIVTSSDPVLSLAAARALVQIDPAAAMPLLVPQICTRVEWPPSKIAGILREAGVEVIARPLAAAVLYATPNTLPWMIRYLDMVPAEVADPVICQVIGTTRDDQLIATCLGALRDPANLPTIRMFVHHPDWRVRRSSAEALGKMGVARDQRLLIEMLDDDEWWVCQAAAQSITRMPLVSRDQLRRIRSRLTSNSARAMLDLALSESHVS